ncbi:hypothetical protein MRB53_040583 [Persea americana]|nr:hypothetical protein MRB53_040583 [Persea americana]
MTEMLLYQDLTTLVLRNVHAFESSIDTSVFAQRWQMMYFMHARIDARNSDSPISMSPIHVETPDPWLWTSTNRGFLNTHPRLARRNSSLLSGTDHFSALCMHESIQKGVNGAQTIVLNISPFLFGFHPVSTQKRWLVSDFHLQELFTGCHQLSTPIRALSQCKKQSTLSTATICVDRSLPFDQDLARRLLSGFIPVENRTLLLLELV